VAPVYGRRNWIADRLRGTAQKRICWF